MEALSLRPGSRTALLAEDETDILLFAPLRAGWARAGRTAPVLPSGYNTRRAVFRALHLHTGRMLCLPQAHKRAENCQEFRDFLREHYRTGPMALLLDESTSHRDEQSQSLAEDLDTQLLWLPKRSPHLNPLDQWGHGKSTVCGNHQPATVEEQLNRFLDFYDGLAATERLRYAGLLSPTY